MVSSGIVPVINFEPFLSGTAEDKLATAQELLKAAKEVRSPFSTRRGLSESTQADPARRTRSQVGFLMLCNVDAVVDKATVAEAFKKTQQFFDLPMEVKERLEWECAESNRGYVAEGRERVTQETDPEAIAKLRQQAPGASLPVLELTRSTRKTS